MILLVVLITVFALGMVAGNACENADITTMVGSNLVYDDGEETRQVH